MLFQILAASVIGGIFSLIGGLVLLWREAWARKISLVLVSFAAGALMGAAFFELIPEALHGVEYETIAAFVIAGILTIFVFEKALKWYHCHDREACEYHTFSITVLFGDAIHNFIDGIIIALSFSVSFAAGVAATTAVFFHEVPQEIGDFGVLLHAGYARAKVLLYNLFAASATPAGALAGYFFLPLISGYVPHMLAFAAGSFIYIAASDLLPELRHKARGVEVWHVASIVLGVALMWLVGEFFHE